MTPEKNWWKKKIEKIDEKIDESINELAFITDEGLSISRNV